MLAPSAGQPLVDPIRAASIAVQILRSGKLSEWSELADRPDIRARVDLTDEQRACLDMSAPVLQWLSLVPKRLPYRCSACGAIAFYGAANPPSKCVLTIGCGGAPVRTPLTVRAAG
ncbi:MAG: hypothetical protein ACTH0V_00275 [Microbacteriaceae bacterium]